MLKSLISTWSITWPTYTLPWKSHNPTNQMDGEFISWPSHWPSSYDHHSHITWLLLDHHKITCLSHDDDQITCTHLGHWLLCSDWAGSWYSWPVAWWWSSGRQRGRGESPPAHTQRREEEECYDTSLHHIVTTTTVVMMIDSLVPRPLPPEECWGRG